MTDSRILDFFRDKLMKITAFFLVAVSGAIFLSLISHSDSDPSFNNATSKVPTNLMGGFGSHLSDLLWQLFGTAGFLVCLLLVMWAYRIYQGFFIPKFWMRAFTAISAIVVTSAVSAVWLSGGVIGDFIKNRLYLDLTDPIYNTVFIIAVLHVLHVCHLY